MGHPKKQRRKFEKPRKPYDKERLEREKRILQEFGLRRKREIWRAEGILRDFRRRARELQATRNEKKANELLSTLGKIGIECRSIDDVLTINLETILSRRLQTIVGKKVNGMKHARQLIVHGHVFIDGRKAKWPSHLVGRDEEGSITISPKIIFNREEKGAS
jgi:small subunit ribosomal protein S4